MPPLHSAAVGALATALLAWTPAAWAQDVSGPALVDCAIAPAVIDATAGPGIGTWTTQLTDDSSGVETAAVLFRDAGFSTFVSTFVDATHRTSGDALDGTYAATFEIPEFAPSGPWTVLSLSVTDADGNVTSVPPPGLPAACSFSVTSNPDIAPPTLGGLLVTPTSTDVTLEPGLISLIATLGDDRSGVDHATVTFESPTGAETVDVEITTAHLTAGDALSGTYGTQFQIPQLAENGTWIVASVRIVDAYGYVTQLDAPSLGLPTPPTIAVTSSADSAAPELVWLSATPATAYLGATTPSIEFEARIRDDVTGLGANGILLQSPVEGVVEALTFDQSDRVSGTLLDGVYRKTVVFEHDAPVGAWAVSASVADPAGNSVQYQGAAVPGPAQVYVSAGAPPPVPVPLMGGLGTLVLSVSLAYVVRRMDLDAR